MTTSIHQAILLLPSPDPILRDSEYRNLLLKQLTLEIDTPRIELPIKAGSIPYEWKTPYQVFQLKQYATLSLWEPQPLHTYIRNWKAHIPFPLIAAIIPVCDPHFTSPVPHHEPDYVVNEKRVQNLLEDQNNLLAFLIEEIKETYNIPIILIYAKRWSDSPNVEDVVSAALFSQARTLSYSMDNMFGLFSDLIKNLPSYAVLVERSELTSLTNFQTSMWGVAKKIPERFVADLAATIHAQQEPFTIWLDGGKSPPNETSLDQDEYQVFYKDMTIAVPTVEYKNQLVAAYYPYIEWQGVAYSSIESLYGNISIDDFQHNLKSEWRISQSISLEISKDQLYPTLDRMIDKSKHRT